MTSAATTEPCPDCRKRHGCKRDCGLDGCQCRGVCAECDAIIERSHELAFGEAALVQEQLFDG